MFILYTYFISPASLAYDYLLSRDLLLRLLRNAHDLHAHIPRDHDELHNCTRLTYTYNVDFYININYRI